jgi:hypothetical protein
MENTIESTETKESNTLFYIIVSITVLIIILITLGGYIFFTRNTPPKAIIQTQQPATDQLLIAPENSGVSSSLITYNILGRITKISKEGNNYSLSLISQRGENLISEFIINSPEMIQVRSSSSDQTDMIELSLDDLKKDDLIEVSLSGNLLSKTYTITHIYKK